jgi:hypothetical protein
MRLEVVLPSVVRVVGAAPELELRLHHERW